MDLDPGEQPGLGLGHAHRVWRGGPGAEGGFGGWRSCDHGPRAGADGSGSGRGARRGPGMAGRPGGR